MPVLTSAVQIQSVYDKRQETIIAVNTDPEYTEQYEWCKFNKIPWIVVLNVEHNQVVVAKWVERTQYESSSESAEE